MRPAQAVCVAIEETASTEQGSRVPRFLGSWVPRFRGCEVRCEGVHLAAPAGYGRMETMSRDHI